MLTSADGGRGPGGGEVGGGAEEEGCGTDRQG